MSYSVEALQDGYCYPDTAVLINKLNIRSQEELNLAEKLYVSSNALKVREHSFSEPFTFDFYCNLHKTLFGDIYQWAGQTRKSEISKGGTSFCPCGEIDRIGKAKFDYLQRENYFCGYTKELYIKELADFYNELNLLHPFREGNGRTQRLFFNLLARRKGYFLDFSSADPNFLIIATIQAANGVTDYLEQFFECSLKLIK